MNLEKLLLGHVSRLRFVRRYSSYYTTQNESVAEHMYWVALYAHVIADHIGLSDASKRLVMARAVMHDIEECLTGDIPRLFKHSNEDMRRKLDEASELAARRIVCQWYPVNHPYVKTSMLFWKLAKTDDPEGWVVSFADYLSVVAYFAQEVSNGNRSLERHIQEVVGYHEKFKKSVFPFEGPQAEKARDLVQQAGVIVQRLAKCCEDAA